MSSGGGLHSVNVKTLGGCFSLFTTFHTGVLSDTLQFSKQNTNLQLSGAGESAGKPGSRPHRSSELVSTGHATSCRPASGWKGSWPRISAHWLVSMLRKERGEERCCNIDETAAVKSADQFGSFAQSHPALATP